MISLLQSFFSFLYYALWCIIYSPPVLLVVLLAYIGYRAKKLRTYPIIKPSLEKIVFVSGCDTGIGLATAQLLAEQGFHVLAAVLNPNNIETLEAFNKGKISAIQVDITDKATIANAVKRTEELLAAEKGKQLAAIVNNAGILLTSPVELQPMTDVKKQMDVNLIGHIMVIKAFLPLLRKSKGRIINVTSTASRSCVPCFSAYCASKFAFRAVSNCLRQELNKFRIALSCIEPGFVKTDLIRGAGGQWEKAKELEGSNYYAPLLHAVSASCDKGYELSSSPQDVANTILEAMTTATPKTSYRVGLDGHIYYYISSLVPERWEDAIVTKLVPLLTSNNNNNNK